MIDSACIDIHLIHTNSTNDDQQFLKQFLNIFNAEYAYDQQEMLQDNRRLLVATHSQYGIVGGLCLSAPHSHPPFYAWHNRLVNFFRDLNECWVASHLFFHLPGEIEEQLLDIQLLKLYSSIFKVFYYKLIYLSVLWKISELRLLFDQERYVIINCGVLPYLSERHFGLDGQAYVLARLSLPAFSYAFFRSLMNKLTNFNDQLLEQLVKEHKWMNYFQSTVEAGHDHTILP